MVFYESRNLKESSLKVLLPSLINDQLFDFAPDVDWKAIYKKYAEEGVDRNPFVKHFPMEGVEIVQYWINHEQAQKSWAKEFKIKYNPENWYLEILEAQILREDPEVIYNTTLTVIPYSFIKSIKKRIHKKIFWICYYGVPRKGEFKIFDQYDLYLTGFDEFESQLKETSQIYEFFPHYFDDFSVQNKIKFHDRSIAFSFLGSLIYKSHTDLGNYRRLIVEQLLDQGKLECWSDITSENPYKVIRGKILYDLHNFFNSLPVGMHLLTHLPPFRKVKDWEVIPNPNHFVNPRFKKKIYNSRYGHALYRVLGNSKITLNVHGQVYGRVGPPVFTVGNIRMFEATGSRCCLLTDHIVGIDRYFEPDKEVVTFKNQNEAKEKSEFLIQNPDYAESIAERGYQRAKVNHSSTVRAKEFLEILKNYA